MKPRNLKEKHIVELNGRLRPLTTSQMNWALNGENVYLRGFGSFIVKTRAEKTARNISKNTTIIIPAHNIPAFKPANCFKEEVAK